MRSGKGLISLIGWVWLVMGIAGMTFSILLGSVRLVIVLILPIVIMEGPIPVISIIFIAVGLVIILLSGTRIKRDIEAEEETDARREEVPGSFSGGGVVFIGPVPIVFGSSSFRRSLPGPFWLWSFGWLLFVAVLGLFIAGALIGLF